MQEGHPNCGPELEWWAHKGVTVSEWTRVDSTEETDPMFYHREERNPRPIPRLTAMAFLRHAGRRSGDPGAWTVTIQDHGHREWASSIETGTFWLMSRTVFPQSPSGPQVSTHLFDAHRVRDGETKINVTSSLSFRQEKGQSNATTRWPESRNN